MNEQNISNIIEYLDQNPDQTIETLVVNLLNEGYPVEDVKAALDRQGISPLVIPGYRETIVYSSPKRSHTGIILLVVAALLSVIIIAVVILIASGYLGRGSVTGARQGSNNAVTATTDPIATLRTQLEKNDYKVATNGIVAYLDNGAISKKEFNNGKTYLDWSGVLTILDTNTKTYKTYFGQTPESTEYNNNKKLDIPPLAVIDETEASKVSWQKVSDTVWESKNVPKQRITFDPQTGLLTKKELINPDGSTAKEETVSYEPITITQDTIKIPSDYTEAK